MAAQANSPVAKEPESDGMCRRLKELLNELREAYSLGKFYVAIVGVPTGFVLLVHKYAHLPFPASLDILQAGVSGLIAAILAWVIKTPAAVDWDDVRPSLAERQLWARWRDIWWSWLAVYSALAIGDFLQAYNSDVTQVSYNFLPQALNNLSSWLFIWMYVVLIANTIEKDDVIREGERLNSERQKRNESLLATATETRKTGADLDISKQHLWWARLFLALTLIQLVTFAAMYMWDVPADGFKLFDLVFSLIYGMLAAMAMSFFFGRLSTSMVRVGPGWCAILFGYAAIQPAYVIIASDWLPNPHNIITVLKLFFLALLFLFKMILFGIMLRLFEERELRFYVTRLPEVKTKIDELRDEFAVKHKAFKVMHLKDFFLFRKQLPG